MEKIQVLEITRPESHGQKYKCIVRLRGFSVADEFDGAEVGESVTFTLGEMTEEELKALPDFAGW